MAGADGRRLGTKAGSVTSDTMRQDARESRRGRDFLFAILSVGLSVVACLLVAEVALRFLPVATGFWAEPVIAEQPIFRFSPNR